MAGRAGGPGPVVVVMVAAGAAWESTALERFGAHRGIVVLKRCVDLDDLLATAAAGQADVAVLALDTHGLDVAAVDHLRAHGVRPVAVASAAEAEAARGQAARVGISTVVVETDLTDLPDAVLAADPGPPSAGTSGPGGSAGSAGSAGGPTGWADIAAGAVVDSRRPGRVVAVWGPSGAPGRSTIAAGLAAVLGRRGVRTILLDADPQGGTLAQSLGVLDEVSGLLAASRSVVAGELAGRFASVQRALDDRLSLVSGLPRADRWVEVRAGTVTALIEQGRRHAQVVVDTGASLEQDLGFDLTGRPGRQAMTLEAISAADELVVVATADPVGLARLARGLSELADLGLEAPVRVVVNRMRPSLGWNQRDLVTMVGRFADLTEVHVVPDDRASADRALVEGRTLVEVAPEGPLVKALDSVGGALLSG